MDNAVGNKLTQREIDYYIDRGVIRAEMGDDDLCVMGTIVLLQKSGLNREIIARFFTTGSVSEKVCILKDLRKKLLGVLHEDQSRLDKIDYLLFELKKSCACLGKN